MSENTTRNVTVRVQAVLAGNVDPFGRLADSAAKAERDVTRTTESMRRTLGQPLAVAVTADVRQARQQADELRRSLLGERVEVAVGADTSRARREVEELRRAIGQAAQLPVGTSRAPQQPADAFRQMLGQPPSPVLASQRQPSQAAPPPQSPLVPGLALAVGSPAFSPPSPPPPQRTVPPPPPPLPTPPVPGATAASLSGQVTLRAGVDFSQALVVIDKFVTQQQGKTIQLGVGVDQRALVASAASAAGPAPLRPPQGEGDSEVEKAYLRQILGGAKTPTVPAPSAQTPATTPTPLQPLVTPTPAQPLVSPPALAPAAQPPVSAIPAPTPQRPASDVLGRPALASAAKLPVVAMPAQAPSPPPQRPASDILGRPAALPVGMDLVQARSQMDRFVTQAQGRVVRLPVEVDTRQAEARLRTLAVTTGHVQAPPPPTSPVQARLQPPAPPPTPPVQARLQPPVQVQPPPVPPVAAVPPPPGRAASVVPAPLPHQPVPAGPTAEAWATVAGNVTRFGRALEPASGAAESYSRALNRALNILSGTPGVPVPPAAAQPATLSPAPAAQPAPLATVPSRPPTPPPPAPAADPWAAIAAASGKLARALDTSALAAESHSKALARAMGMLPTAGPPTSPTAAPSPPSPSPSTPPRPTTVNGAPVAPMTPPLPPSSPRSPTPPLTAAGQVDPWSVLASTANRLTRSFEALTAATDAHTRALNRALGVTPPTPGSGMPGAHPPGTRFVPPTLPPGFGGLPPGFGLPPGLGLPPPAGGQPAGAPAPQGQPVDQPNRVNLGQTLQTTMHGVMELTRGMILLGGQNEDLQKVLRTLMMFQGTVDIIRGLYSTTLGLVDAFRNFAPAARAAAAANSAMAASTAAANTAGTAATAALTPPVGGRPTAGGFGRSMMGAGIGAAIGTGIGLAVQTATREQGTGYDLGQTMAWGAAGAIPGMLMGGTRGFAKMGGALAAGGKYALGALGSAGSAIASPIGAGVAGLGALGIAAAADFAPETTAKSIPSFLYKPLLGDYMNPLMEGLGGERRRVNLGGTLGQDPDVMRKQLDEARRKREGPLSFDEVTKRQLARRERFKDMQKADEESRLRNAAYGMASDREEAEARAMIDLKRPFQTQIKGLEDQASRLSPITGEPFVQDRLARNRQKADEKFSNVQEQLQEAMQQSTEKGGSIEDVLAKAKEYNDLLEGRSDLEKGSMQTMLQMAELDRERTRAQAELQVAQHNLQRGRAGGVKTAAEEADLQWKYLDALQKVADIEQQRFAASKAHATAEADRYREFAKHAEAAEKFYSNAMKAEQKRLDSMKSSFGLLSASDRQAAVGVAQKISEGKGLSKQEQEFAQRHSGVFGEKLEEIGAQNAAKDGTFEKITQFLGLDKRLNEARAANATFNQLKVQAENRVTAQIDINEGDLARQLGDQVIPPIRKMILELEARMKKEAASLEKQIQDARAGMLPP